MLAMSFITLAIFLIRNTKEEAKETHKKSIIVSDPGDEIDDHIYQRENRK